MGTDPDAVTAVLVMNRGDKDLKLVRSVLHKVGFRVANFEDGNELLRSVAGGDTSLRLVVVDPAAPNLQFEPFLEKLRRAVPDIGVLCLSEEGITPPSASTKHIGRCLTRPFRRAQLLASVLEATEKPLVRAETKDFV